MKRETFDQAQWIVSRIDDYDSAIGKMEEPKPLTPPINLPLCDVGDSEALKNTVLKFLKASRSKLQKEFENLK